ncbi:hypothetical protein BGZ81_001367 [Podila clonocystis]|nr:hypothetical protein BGZ81_001367 [Podila clonocystis]
MNFFRKKTSEAQHGTTSTNNKGDGKSKQTALQIEVQTASRVTLRKDYQLPLIYNSIAAPTHMAALITFETPNKWAADEIEILFSVSVSSHCHESVKYFAQHRWTLPVTHLPSSSSDLLIAPGRYTRLVHAALDPTWPSSCSHPAGAVRYSVNVRALVKKRAPLTLITQNVWVIQRNVPAHLDHSITTDLPPYVVEDLWKKHTLPVSITLPSQYLSLGEVVPVTIALYAFLRDSKFEGQVAHVVRARFVLQEMSSVRVKGANALPTTKDMLAIALNDGWPSRGAGWERTVRLTLPGPPMLSPSMTTGVLDVWHVLLVTMKVRTGGGKMEEFKVSWPKPQPVDMYPEGHDVQALHYTDVLHNSQDGHPGEELPSYVQREP